MPEPFTQLLADLVGNVDGAIAAAFMDNYGEAVQTHPAGDDEDYIKLMGAYQGIAFQTSRGIVSQLNAGGIDYVITSYDKVSFLIKALDHDYFLMLLMNPTANLGKGIFNVQRFAAAFNQEI